MNACPRCGGYLRTIHQLDGWISSTCINCGFSADYAPRRARPVRRQIDPSASYCVRCRATTPHRPNGPIYSRSWTYKKSGRPGTTWFQPLACRVCNTHKSPMVPRPSPAEAATA